MHLGMVAYILNLSTRRQGQYNLCQFKPSLVYVARVR